MKLSRKLMMGAGALTITVGLVTVLGGGVAQAKKSGKSAPTGTVTCSSITGTVTFKPPLTLSGTSSESAKSSTKFSGCTTSSGTAVTGGKSSAPVAVSSNSCTGLEGGSGSSAAISFDITWSPKTAGKTVIAFSGETPTSNPSNDEGFKLTGGTASGSFAESGTATGEAFTNETATALATACGSSAGLSKITIVSGNLSA